MAREEIFFGINIDTGEVIKDFGTLKKRTKELKKELDGTNVGTKRFEELKKEITANQATIRRFNRSLRDTKSLATRVGQGVTTAFKRVGGVLAGAFAVSKLVEFSKEVANITSKFEKLEAVLETALGSKSEAQKSFQMIQKFAARTNFSVLELTDAYVKLVNQGFKPTISEIENLADLANSTGKSFDQLTEAIIDAQVGEFERLKEFGIRAKKEGDNVKFTFKGVETQVKFTEKAIQGYILALGDLQGVSGSTQKISQTLGGAISNLGDAWDSFLVSLGTTDSFLGKIIRGFVNLSSSVIKFFTETEKGSDKLQKQRMELNLLVARITDANIKESERLKLVKELNSVYPDFLGNLEAEKATNEQIANRLKQVNQELINKIALQLQDEKLQEKLTEAARLQNIVFEQEQEIRSDLIKLNEEYGLGIDFVNTTLEEQITKAKEGLDAQTEVIDNIKTGIVTTNAQGKANNDLTLSLVTLKSAQEDVNEATEEANKLQKQRQDLVKSLFGGVEPTDVTQTITTKLSTKTDSTKGPIDIATTAEDSAAVQFAKAQTIALEKESKKQVANLKDANNEKVESEKMTTEQIKMMDNARLESQAALVGSTISLLSRDEESRKKNGKLIKALALAEIAINTQKALMNVEVNEKSPLFLPNLFTGGLAGLTVGTAQKIAIIAQGITSAAIVTQQKFAKGGILNGPSHANGGIKTPFGELEGGEAVINKKSTKKYGGILSAINEAEGGKRFARGGVLGVPNVSNAPNNSNLDIIRAINSINMSPTVSVVEINEAQTRISEIENNSTL